MTESMTQVQIMDPPMCGVTKMTVLDGMILGKPIMVKKDKFNRLWSEPILELISYDAYMLAIQKEGASKLDSFEHVTLRSVTGRDYNYWLPIFINRKHFDLGFEHIKNAFTVIKYGVSGTTQNDFKPNHVLEVLPSLMNKTVVQLLNGSLHESKEAIEAYCHFLRLFMELIEVFPQIKMEIEHRISDFKKGPEFRNKKVIPDIGEFITMMAVLGYSYDELKELLLEEYFARQILWIEKAGIQILDAKSIDLKKTFEANRVSCQLLVFNLEMIRFFIYPEAKKDLDARYGYPPEDRVNTFQLMIRKIKDQIQGYQIFMLA